MSVYDKKHYNIAISLQLVKINEKKNVHTSHSVEELGQKGGESGEEKVTNGNKEGEIAVN